MVSIIIPAFNEEKTIGELVRSVIKHPQVLEVIVIDDGSTDGTQEVAVSAGAKVFHLPENTGKANAMDVGVKMAESNIILFLDADVVGFTEEKISTIINPVLQGGLEMHVGILPRWSLSIFSKKVFYILPVLSGMRALTKALWYRVPIKQKQGFKIELALNYTARKWGSGTGYEIIPGLTHIIKEKKHGLFGGFWRRIKMFRELVSISFELYILETIKNIFIWLRKSIKLEFNR
ncbi:MAG: glycosyltransferase family 2 protein [Patescibacteria group bacterium]